MSRRAFAPARAETGRPRRPPGRSEAGPGVSRTACPGKRFAQGLFGKLYVELAVFPGVATRNDHYLALAYAVRDRLLHRWVDSARAILEQKSRTVIYLSAEYLIGPQLASNLLALGLHTAARMALDEMGVSLDELGEHEEEPGLGNGGLGRLAACFKGTLAPRS